MHRLAGMATDSGELGNSLLIPGGTSDLHASKEVQAEASLGAFMAKETVVHALGRWIVKRLCSNHNNIRAPQAASQLHVNSQLLMLSWCGAMQRILLL